MGDHQSERIRQDIERTRSQIDNTIRALNERMTVEQLVGKFVSAFRGSEDETMKAGSRAVIDAARSNPVPLALMGAGLVWLLIEERRGSKAPVITGDVIRTGNGHRREGQSWVARGKEKMSAVGEAARERMHQASEGVSEGEQQLGESISELRGKAADTAHSVGERAREAGGKVSDTISGLRGRAADTAHSLSEKTHGVSERARHRMGQAQEGLVNQWEENPLVFGAVAFALGLIGGLALPSTEREDRLMGRKADAVKGRLGAAGQEALEKGKRVASRAVEAARTTAEQEGLRPSDLAERAKHVVQEVGEAGTSGLREQRGLESPSEVQGQQPVEPTQPEGQSLGPPQTVNIVQEPEETVIAPRAGKGELPEE